MKIELITMLYLCAGVVNIIGYAPTIKDLIQKKKTANTKSYFIWTICAAITLTYATVVISDTLFIVIAMSTFLLSATILTISLKLEKFP